MMGNSEPHIVLVHVQVESRGPRKHVDQRNIRIGGKCGKYPTIHVCMRYRYIYISTGKGPIQRPTEHLAIHVPPLKLWDKTRQSTCVTRVQRLI